MSDFLDPTYHAEVMTAIGYGLKVVVGMLVASGLFVLLGGGSAATAWENQRKQAEH